MNSRCLGKLVLTGGLGVALAIIAAAPRQAHAQYGYAPEVRIGVGVGVGRPPYTVHSYYRSVNPYPYGNPYRYARVPGAYYYRTQPYIAPPRVIVAPRPRYYYRGTYRVAPGRRVYLGY